MRIAFSTQPALGHLLPMIPLALAARDAGHEVVMLGGSSLAGPIAQTGLPHGVARRRRTSRRRSRGSRSAPALPAGGSLLRPGASSSAA
jgi:UDP:flavonoid glycosyltransferase YjiC (YdhE family)